jgi:hypothetical protein
MADGTLKSTGPLKRAGTDQKDIGVDFGELQQRVGPLAGTGPAVRVTREIGASRALK